MIIDNKYSKTLNTCTNEKNRFSNQFGFRDSKSIYRFKFQIKWKKRKKNVNGNAFQTTWKYTDDLKRIAVYGERPNG